MQPKAFTASLWIHGDNGKRVAYELFSVSGHDISLEILDDMRKNASDVDWLASLPTECAVQVLVEVTENEDWYVYHDLFNYRALSWLVESEEVSVIDKFIESIDLPF